MYDGVAHRHWNLDDVRAAIYNYRPSIALFDAATPTVGLVDEMANWLKATVESIIVYCGPHMKAFAATEKAKPHVDQVIVGEMERPMLDIVRRYPNGDGIYSYQHLEQLNELPNGENFLPYRDWSKMGLYYDPSMQTPRTQVQVNTSRSCPFTCTYCTTSRVFENAPYRARSAEAVVDELRQIKSNLGGSLGSFFYDDDTWNINPGRLKKICAGMKELGVQWTMMGRIDTCPKETYDVMVDSGCVGMRFGVESFNQRLLDNTKKKLSAETSADNIRYLLTRFKGMEFHFTTLTGMPGSSPQDDVDDKRILAELIALGAENGHRVHYQRSEVVPFPGTELWEELVELGHGAALTDHRSYDGHPDHNRSLIKTIGLLGANYSPRLDRKSGDGTPIGA